MYNENQLTPDRKSCFKEKFNYFKCRKDVNNKDLCTATEKNIPIIEDTSDRKVFGLLGLTDVKCWKIFNFPENPGLILIRNAFTGLGQRYWIRRCLEEYPRNPNKTNLHNESNIEDWWEFTHRLGKCDKKLRKKLRWTTFGYHHDWDTKVYKEDNRSYFPEDLAELCSTVGSIFGFRDFKAQASIVNYYHMDSTISPHTDHSEVNLEAPLFSFSFGQSAVFLIGGKEKSQEPSALLLNSGDIVIMSDEARLCYHAVPKILHTESKPWDDIKGLPVKKKISQCQKQRVEAMNKNIDNSGWELFNDYIQESRININVRQVLYDNQNKLPELP